VDITKNSLPAYKEYKALFVIKDKTIFTKPNIVLVEEINQIVSKEVV
jgi:hypothetical protein